MRAPRGSTIILLAIGLGAAACDPLAPFKAIDDPQPIAGLEVVPDSTSVIVGDTIRYALAIKGSGGSVITQRTVAWSVGNPAVASVNDSGLVTARAVGRSEVFATVEGLRATGVLSVRAAPPPPPPATP